jgi:hypothetical protein
MLLSCGNTLKSAGKPVPFGCGPNQTFPQVSVVHSQDRDESRLGPYLLLAHLGSGSFGDVYCYYNRHRPPQPRQHPLAISVPFTNGGGFEPI